MSGTIYVLSSPTPTIFLLSRCDMSAGLRCRIDSEGTLPMIPYETHSSTCFARHSKSQGGPNRLHTSWHFGSFSITLRKHRYHRQTSPVMVEADAYRLLTLPCSLYHMPRVQLSRTCPEEGKDGSKKYMFGDRARQGRAEGGKGEKELVFTCVSRPVPA